MRNPDVIHSGTNIYRLNDRYPLAGVAQGATLSPAAFQGFRLQVQGLEEPPVELLSWSSRIFADPEVIHHMPKRDLTPYQPAKRALRVSDENWKAHGYGGWVIRDKSDGQPVGSCDLNSEELGEVELGYCQAKAYWGKGLAIDVARAVVRFAFEDLKLERLVAVVVPENIA